MIAFKQKKTYDNSRHVTTADVAQKNKDKTIYDNILCNQMSNN